MPLKILIAEDNEAISNAYAKLLTKRGHLVIVTKNGVECIKRYESELKAGKTKESLPFDVVIVDQSMPLKDGATLVGEILDLRPRQRIIFATAHKDQVLENYEKIRRGVELFEKPFHLENLIKAVESKVHKLSKQDVVMRGFRKWDGANGISQTAGPGPNASNSPTLGYKKITQ